MSKSVRNYYIKLFLVSIIIFFIAIFIFFIALSKDAKADDINNVRYKYFHVITIEKGDSIWSLAGESGYENERNEFIKEVMDMNHMKNNSLKEGQMLAVPYYSYEFKL